MDLNEIMRRLNEPMRKTTPPFASIEAPYYQITGPRAGTATIELREHDGTRRKLLVHLLTHPGLYDSESLAGWLYRRDCAEQTKQEGYL